MQTFPSAWVLFLVGIWRERVQFKRGRLEASGTHPLYSIDCQQFIPTEDIKVGEHLLSKSGIITVVSKTYDPTAQEVYNLEVGQWHNFLVGVSGVVAHNNYIGCLTSVSIEGVELLSGTISKIGNELIVEIPLIYKKNGYTGKVFKNLTDHLDEIAKTNNATSQKIIFQDVGDIPTREMYKNQAAIYGFNMSYKSSPISAPGFPVWNVTWIK